METGTRVVNLPSRPGKAVRSVLFLTGCSLTAWLLMQIVHESGHVLAAWVSGGTVNWVRLHPLQISETNVRPNPAPVFEVFAGPIWGCLLPLLLWGAIRKARLSREFFARFFAGFCLIANGAYLGSGVFDPVGDAFDLVQLDFPRWGLGLFALLTVIPGIWLWDGIGSHFGIGRDVQPVKWTSIATVWGILLLIVLAELFWSHFQGAVVQ